jgi:hypothetical protein
MIQIKYLDIFFSSSPSSPASPPPSSPSPSSSSSPSPSSSSSPSSPSPSSPSPSLSPSLSPSPSTSPSPSPSSEQDTKPRLHVDLLGPQRLSPRHLLVTTGMLKLFLHACLVLRTFSLTFPFVSKSVQTASVLSLKC